MTRFAFITLILLASTAAASAREQSLLARVTAYWRGEGQYRSATGSHLRSGHCAVDPKRIPYGSRVVLPDGELVAVDTGPAVVNRSAARRSGRNPAQRAALVIDRFFESKREAVAWLSGHPAFMTVKVVTPESRSRPAVVASAPRVAAATPFASMTAPKSLTAPAPPNPFAALKPLFAQRTPERPPAKATVTPDATPSNVRRRRVVDDDHS